MIEEKLIQSICSTINNGNRVNRLLPPGGKMMMDQLLPFICVYRYSKSPDPGFTQLVRTQASYLIAEETVDLKDLIVCVTSTISKKFNSFLILEFWPDPDPNSEEFQIFCPEKSAPTTIKSLVNGLNEIKDIYPSLEVTIKDVYQRHPSHLRPLLLIDETKELGCLLIGISVPTIFKESSSGKPYALLLRKFKRKLSEVIKKTAFEFIRVQASKAFNHYLTLGKTRLDNLIRFADKQLASISHRMNFLMRITPVNGSQEWESFKKNRFEKTPSFKYRLIPLDPEVEKRKLYKIHIERIEDPTLAHIFREKRMELEKQLIMLEERGTRSFRYIGQSLYGRVHSNTLSVADDLLKVLERKHSESSEMLDCHGFAAHAQAELEIYKKEFPGIDLGVEIRKDVNGVMVSKGHLLISQDFLISTNRIEALIQHEVGTHILTYCNGYKQPLQQLYAGLAGYDQLQEGLAVLSEYLADGLTSERLRLLAGRVRAVDAMVHGADFIETFRLLKDDYHFDNKLAYFISMRVFRGGGFPKDALYLDGLLHLLKYLQSGGDLELLYSGKFHLKHVPVIEELMHRQILKSPFLSPHLKSERTKERIIKLEQVTHLTELLNTKNHEHSIHH